MARTKADVPTRRYVRGVCPRVRTTARLAARARARDTLVRSPLACLTRAGCKRPMTAANLEPDLETQLLLDEAAGSR